MSLDFATTVALIAFLVGIPVTLFFTNNLSDRYETKVARIIIGICGSLEQPLRDLRGLPVITNHHGDQTQLVTREGEPPQIVATISEREQYRDHQQFMSFVERNLLDKFNDYHNMLTIQNRFETNINSILFKICFLVIPCILFELYDNPTCVILGFIAFYILSLWIAPNIGRLYRDHKAIKEAYVKYVSEDTIFGYYD
ncbi:MAG: hypothetical protein ABFC24_04410 [Methanoregulaceae archaeon]